jgi:hypothetical protein
MACGIDMDDWGCSDVNEKVTGRGFSSMICTISHDRVDASVLFHSFSFDCRYRAALERYSYKREKSIPTQVASRFICLYLLRLVHGISTTSGTKVQPTKFKYDA